MARTFSPFPGSGSGGSIAVGDKWGQQKIEKTRQALDLFAYAAIEFDMGGEETPTLIALAGTWQRVRRSLPRTINFDNLGGLTKEFVFHYYTTDAGTSVQARLRDTTNNQTMATSTLSTATTLQTQVVTLSNVPSGNADLVLQFDAGNTNAGVVVYGYIRLRLVPT